MPLRSRFPRLVLLLLACLAGLPAGAAGQESRPRLVGVFDWDSGEPVVGAEVALLGTALRWRTSAEGVVALAGAPAGSWLLQVRRVGYRAHTEAIVVSAADTAPVTISLPSAAVALPEVRVEERPENVLKLQTTGFYQRRKTSPAPPSAFWTRDDLERIKATRWEQVVEKVHGGRVDARGNLLLRCGTPQVVLDGISVQGLPLKDLHLTEVAALEFYSGAGQVPVEFNGTAASAEPGMGAGSANSSLSAFHRKFNAYRAGPSRGCVVVVWTR